MKIHNITNLNFLNEKYPELAKLGEFAEKYIYQDSNTTFIQKEDFTHKRPYSFKICENYTSIAIIWQKLY